MQDFVYRHLKDDVRLTDDEIDDLGSRCEIFDIEYKGAITCALFVSGNEVHLLANPDHVGRCFSRRLVLQKAAELLAEKSFLTTRIPRGAPKRDRTGERMGFTHTWSDDRFDYYILTEVPYARLQA